MTTTDDLARRSGHSGEDRSRRSQTRRDRDRILYSAAFRRLQGVTQVTTPSWAPDAHNRLTHSLRVEQVGIGLAGFLAGMEGAPEIDVDAVSAACLAHDLGHAPFGHAGEEELHALVTCPNHRHTPRPLDQRTKHPCFECKIEDGFEGNAQSLRLLARLEVHAGSLEKGLDLTRRSLAGSVKYPWLRGDCREKPRKWGAYDDDEEILQWAVDGARSQTLTAQIMDWADDVTFAVHDIEDYYRSGLIPLGEYAVPSSTRENFWQYATKVANVEAELDDIVANIYAWFPRTHFRDTASDHEALDSMRTALITYFLNHAKLDGQGNLEIPREVRQANSLVKQLTWYHVIDNPDLAAVQEGQREVLRRIFRSLEKLLCEGDLWRGGLDATLSKHEWSAGRKVPARLRRFLTAAWRSGDDKLTSVHRAIIDYLASLGDAEAYQLDALFAGRVLPSSQEMRRYL